MSGGSNHRTAIHELGHALGLSHEHQRYDRDRYIQVLAQNIQRGKEDQFTTTDYGGGSYDLRSIMHYPSDAFSANGKPTLLTKSGAPIPIQTALTATDISRVRSMYGTTPPTVPATDGESVIDQISGAISDAASGVWDLLAQAGWLQAVMTVAHQRAH